MVKKLKNFLCAPSKSAKFKVGIVSMLVCAIALMPMAFAGSDATLDETVNALLDTILDVFFYIGVLLLAWSVGMLVLAFKNEDADSKSRAMMMLVVSVALMGLKTLLETVLGSTGFTMS